MAVGLGLGTLFSGLFGAGASAYGNSKQTQAANEAARLQADATTRAAEMQAKAAADALAFTKEQEAARAGEWQKTQDWNAATWQQQYDYTKQLEAEKQARLRPFQGLGVGAIGQMSKPIPSTGSIASLMGK
jgi:hypothetical protein